MVTPESVMGQGLVSVVTDFRQRVARALVAGGVEPGDRVCVACSYGPDSLALADAVLGVRRQLGLAAVTLCYVDHGLRRLPARHEQEQVRAFARAHHAGCEIASVRVVSRGSGWEAAARAERYRALDEIAERVGARFVLTGHTASDQAETVLDRCLRGAGPVGLTGILARRGRVLRPLLELARGRIDRYLQARGLEPAQDETNLSPRFRRNRLRHQILPALRRENPQVDQALCRLAERMAEQSELLAWVVARERARVVCAPGSVERDASAEAVVLDVAALAALPMAARAAILQRECARLGASLEDRHLRTLADLLHHTDGSETRDLPGLFARREYARLHLVARSRAPARALPPPLTISGSEATFRVRAWRPGDRMRPARLKGRSRKLQDLFVDLKVPRAHRRHARVVERVTDGVIVWAEHVGAAFDVDVTVRLTNQEP